MRKGNIYSLLGLCMSLTIVLGGWSFTREMLRYKEEQLFSKQGQILMEIPHITIEPMEEMEEAAFEKKTLSEEMMAEILFIWESGGIEEYHEPMPGQMNMEQAIEAGQAWIQNMEKEGVLSTELSGKEFARIQARLCSVRAAASIEKALISYWTVIYVTDDVEVVLKIHAWTGQVWEAHISAEEQEALTGVFVDDGQTEADMDEKLIKAAFPFLDGWSDRDDEMAYVGEKYMFSRQGLIRAGVIRYSMVSESRQAEVKYQLRMLLCTEPLYYGNGSSCDG